jgi:Protein of unknown function (DUF3445)
MRPDLRLLPAGDGLLDWSPDSPQALAEKIQTAHTIHCSDAIPERVISDACAMLAARHPNLLALEHDAHRNLVCLHAPLAGVTVARTTAHSEWHCTSSRGAARIQALAPEQRLWGALGFMLHEDLVLLQMQELGLIAKRMHVSFPSGWLPAEKIGLSLEAIHGPVADGQLLRSASKALGATMVSRGPFERFVWTICNSASRARISAPETAESAQGELFFRWERQLTLPLPAHASALFLIRIYTAPLEQVFANEKMKMDVLASLGSMSDEVLAYKNLQGIRKRLLSNT